MKLRRITYHVQCGSERSELVQAGDVLVHEHARYGTITYWLVVEAREGRKGVCTRHADEWGVVCCRRWGLFCERVSAPPEGARLLGLVWDRR